MSSLQLLDLGSNQLNAIGIGSLAGLRNLQTLVLSGNQIGEIDGGLSELTSLMTLTMRNNNLAKIVSTTFDAMSQLLTLNLAYNRLTQVPNLLGLQRLEALSLGHNEIFQLDQYTFSKLERLDFISMEYNALTTIPEQLFATATKVSMVDLAHNQLTAIPAQLLAPLSNLQKLDLSSNSLTFMEPDLFQCNVWLDSLDFSSNSLSQLSESLLGGLTRLTDLMLADNMLTDLIPLHLPSLLQLNVDRNYLTTLRSAHFTALSSLTGLSAVGNRLASLPADLLRASTALIYLSLQNNHLAALPPSLLAQVDLKTLFLSNNSLVALPATVFGNVGRRLALQMLLANHNRITSLPTALLAAMPSLSQLLLADNRLSKFEAAWIKGKELLNTLQVNGNQLTYFDDSMLRGCTVIRNLILGDNPWHEIQLTGMYPSVETLRLGCQRPAAQLSLNVAGFPSLQTADFRGFSLTSVQLRAVISAPKLTALTLGDTTFCDELGINALQVPEDSLLTTVTVSQITCTNLVVYAPSLQVIEVTGNPFLEDLGIISGSLTTVNVSYNPKLWLLSELVVRTLDISYTNISYSSSFGSVAGTFELTMQGMRQQASFAANLPKLISNCFTHATVCDLANNAFVNDIVSLNAGYNMQSILLVEESVYTASIGFARPAISLIQLGDVPVQCQLKAKIESYTETYEMFGQHDTLRTAECSCSLGIPRRLMGHASYTNPAYGSCFARVAVLLLSCPCSS